MNIPGWNDILEPRIAPLELIPPEAVKLVIREQKASTSFVQRHFRIGYNRAATIIEKMEENNIVSKPGRAGKREIMSENQWRVYFF